MHNLLARSVIHHLPRPNVPFRISFYICISVTVQVLLLKIIHDLRFSAQQFSTIAKPSALQRPHVQHEQCTTCHERNNSIRLPTTLIASDLPSARNAGGTRVGRDSAVTSQTRNLHLSHADERRKQQQQHLFDIPGQSCSNRPASATEIAVVRRCERSSS